MRSKKVILDTNLWISFLISRKLDFLDDLVISGKIQLIFSRELIEEFITVAQRPKFEKYFSNENIKDLLKFFDSYGKLINVKSSVEECRDYKDNFLLNLAIDSNANYLVTGDDDLLTIKKINKTKIITWADFLVDFK
jgi:uncharacterized protein